MPRLRSSALRYAAAHHPLLPSLLRSCRDLNSAKNELRWLREHALAITRSAKGRQTEAWRARLHAMCLDRAKGRPLQYIIGNQPFGELEILCQKGVLIPRPETESITSHLVGLIRPATTHKLRVLDLCSGTGCIALLLHSLLMQHVADLQVHGIDVSPLAVGLARKNIKHNMGKGFLKERATKEVGFVNADVLEDNFVENRQLHYDVLVSNPPYISPQAFATTTSRSVRNYEPIAALVPRAPEATTSDEARGDLFYPRLLQIANRVQAKVLLLEVADMAQAKRVAGLIVEDPTWHGCEIWRDWPGQTATSDVVSVEVKGRDIDVRGDGHGRAVFAWTKDGKRLLR